MAGHWTTDTSGSDTETEEDSLPESRMLATFETFDQEEVINVSVENVGAESHEIAGSELRDNEVIVLSSDGDSSSHSSNERLSTSYASSSESLASDHSGNSPIFNMALQALDHQFFFRQNHQDFRPRVGQLPEPSEQSAFNGMSTTGEESSQDDLNSSTPAEIQEAIKQRLPTLNELEPIEVTLSSGRKILADFPKIKDIIASSVKDKNELHVPPNETTSPVNKSSKYNTDSLAIAALKRYQVSSISDAVWRPLIRKAELIHRRGKQLESMGSTGNPTYLEFYEALYLTTRAKLYLLSPDMTPMTVFDAHSDLIRNSDDLELYSIYEYLMDSNAIVVPFRPLKVETVTHAVPSKNCEVIVGEPRATHVTVPCAQPPPRMSNFTAYGKDDSDSDLEVLSCNMPVTSKQAAEVVYGYEQSAPYEGPEISFPELRISMQSTALQEIPQQLLPQCRTTDAETLTHQVGMKIPVEGGQVSLQPYWFTPEGMENADYIEYFTEGQKRPRKRKKSPRVSLKKHPKKKQRVCLDHMLLACCPSQAEDPLPADRIPDRYHRRWFPRWFDGIELGVHSMSIVDTLHKFTNDGIPKIEQAHCWLEYKNAFAKLVRESLNLGNENSLFRGDTTPLMTGTKGNQTQLIFGELLLTQEVSEPSDLRERIQNGYKNLTNCVEDKSLAATTTTVNVNTTACFRHCPKIVFDVYIDSAYSKSKPSTPDYRVVQSSANSVLKISDLLKLTLEAGDATLLVAHVADGKVRVRQAMTFSIPRYN